MMKKNKKCNFCNIVKSLQHFHKDRTANDKHTARCILCTKLYYKNYYYKKDNKKPYFPYKSLKDPKYLKDRRDLFRESENGWWIEDKSRYRGRRKPK